MYERIATEPDLRKIQEQLNAIYDYLEVYVVQQPTTNGIFPRLSQKKFYEGATPEWVITDNDHYRNQFK